TVHLAGDSEDVAQRLGRAAADVDVVLDYIWGEPTAAAMAAVVTHRTDRGKPLAWIPIGSVGGATSPLPSASLRASRPSLRRTWQGSVSSGAILTELPALAEAITAGTFQIDARSMPIEDVEAAWAQVGRTRQRIVIVPQN